MSVEQPPLNTVRTVSTRPLAGKQNQCLPHVRWQPESRRKIVKKFWLVMSTPLPHGMNVWKPTTPTTTSQKGDRISPHPSRRRAHKPGS